MAKGKTHAKNRQRLRRKLEAQGYNAAYIDRVIAQKRDQQAAARLQPVVPPAPQPAPVPRERLPRQVTTVPVVEGYVERLQAETYRRLEVDDSKHRPRTPDPLTRGVARVSAATAKAVRRSKATTRYEYDQQQGRG